MFEYTSTSRIRRKVKSKLKDLRNKVQEEVTVTLNEFSAVEGENFQQKIKRMMRKKPGTSSSESSDDSSGDSSEEVEHVKKSVKQRLVWN